MADLAISNEQLIKNLDKIALRVAVWPEWKKEAWAVLGLNDQSGAASLEQAIKTVRGMRDELDKAVMAAVNPFQQEVYIDAVDALTRLLEMIEGVGRVKNDSTQPNNNRATTTEGEGI